VYYFLGLTKVRVWYAFVISTDVDVRGIRGRPRDKMRVFFVTLTKVRVWNVFVIPTDVDVRGIRVIASTSSSP
jgi:hypothetical protein